MAQETDYEQRSSRAGRVPQQRLHWPLVGLLTLVAVGGGVAAWRLTRPATAPVVAQPVDPSHTIRRSPGSLPPSTTSVPIQTTGQVTPPPTSVLKNDRVKSEVTDWADIERKREAAWAAERARAAAERARARAEAEKRRQQEEARLVAQRAQQAAEAERQRRAQAARSASQADAPPATQSEQSSVNSAPAGEAESGSATSPQLPGTPQMPAGTSGAGSANPGPVNSEAAESTPVEAPTPVLPEQSAPPTGITPSTPPTTPEELPGSTDSASPTNNVTVPDTP